MTNTKARPSITSMGSSWRSVASRWFGLGTSVVRMSANIAFDPIRSFWPNTKLSITSVDDRGAYNKEFVHSRFSPSLLCLTAAIWTESQTSSIFCGNFSLNITLLSLIGNSFSSANASNWSCPFSVAVSRSVSIAWVTKSLFATFCSLWLFSREGTKYIKNCEQSSSCESRFILLLVVSWGLHSSDSRPKAILDSLARWDRNLKDNAHLLRGDDFVFPIILPPSYQCTRAIPGCDRSPPGLTAVESACQQNFQPQTLSRLLVEVDASHSERWLPIEHSWLYCNAWNRATCSGRRGGADLKSCPFEHARTAGYGTICM